MGIPENIDALLVKYDITQDYLARVADVTPGAVTGWRKGSHPREDAIRKICEKFGLDRDDLVSDSRGLAAKEHGHVYYAFISLPLFDSVSAGEPIEELPVDEKRVAPSKFTDDDPDCFFVRVNGDSMNRHIHDGNFALVSPKYRETNPQDMYLVTVNGDDATIRHVKKLANGVELSPDSYDPTYRSKVIDYNEEDAPEVTVLGKVVWWCSEY